MANFKPIMLPESQIKTYPIKEGQLLFTTDTYGIYLDISGSERKAIKQIMPITEEERTDMLLPLIGFYYTTDTKKLYYYDSDWQLINENISISKSSKNGHLSVNGVDILVYDPSDLSVSYGESELSALVSGEFLSVSLGKVKTAVDSLISHLSNFTNPHKVSKSQIGLSKVDNLSSEDILNLITYDHIVNALGYVPPTQDTTYKAATSKAMGLVKSGNHISVGSDGTVTVVGGYATQLAKNIMLSLTGVITGSVSFNGSKDIIVETSLSSVPASKITGVLSIDNLPQGALERLVKVANKAARLELTQEQVQLGDSVQELDTGTMYIVVDEEKLNTEEGYTVYTAGSASSVPWSGVTGKPESFTPSVHTHTKNQITDFPTSMPASDVHPWAKEANKPTYTPTEVGVISTAPTSGQVAVFDGTTGKIKSTGFTIESSVPSGAKFTDTVYVHPTETAFSSGLYKITTNETGHITAATPVVKSDITSLGIPDKDTVYTLPVATTELGGVKTTSKVSSTEGYTAVPIIEGIPYYKDTVYTHPGYTEHELGLYKTKIDVTGHVSQIEAVTKDDIVSLGILDSIPVATDSVVGGVKSGGDITVSSAGDVTINVATKLRTAVKIGEATFDGSTSISLSDIGIKTPIEITKAEYDKLKESGKLDMTAYYNIIDDYDAVTIINDTTPAENQVYSSSKSDSTYAKKSTIVNTTLTSQQWTGDNAPYSYTLSVDGVTENSINEITYAKTATNEQIEAYQSAQFRDGGQSANQIIILASEKPNVDIPIVVIVRHDN